MIVIVGGSAEVSRVGEGSEDSGGCSAGDSAGIHLAEYHSGRLDQTERGVNSQQFAGGTGFKQVSIIHTKSVCPPVQGVAGQLGELVSAVSGGGKGFLERVAGYPVILAHPDATLPDIHVLGGVRGGFAYDVWA
jgi:hypothetical protein